MPANDRQNSLLHGPANFTDDFFLLNLNGKKRKVSANKSLLLFYLNAGLNQAGFSFSVFHQTPCVYWRAYRPECSSAKSALHGIQIVRMIVPLSASCQDMLLDFDELFPLFLRLRYRHDRTCSLFLQDYETLTYRYFQYDN